MNKIKELPKEVQPREKAIKYGISSLSNIELLAIIIASGYQGVNVLSLASDLLNEFGGLLHLSNANFQSLKAIKGIKVTKALQLLAAFEIHKRIINESIQFDKNDFENYIRQKYTTQLFNEEQEVLYILILNRRKELIFEDLLYKGNYDCININIDEIIKTVIIHKGKYFVLVHNHPSGNYEPSSEDLSSTTKLIFKANLMSVKLLDHYIVSKKHLISIVDILKVKM